MPRLLLRHCMSSDSLLVVTTTRDTLETTRKQLLFWSSIRFTLTDNRRKDEDGMTSKGFEWELSFGISQWQWNYKLKDKYPLVKTIAIEEGNESPKALLALFDFWLLLLYRGRSDRTKSELSVLTLDFFFFARDTQWPSIFLSLRFCFFIILFALHVSFFGNDKKMIRIQEEE